MAWDGVDRRKGPDFLSKSVKWLTGIGWILLFAGMNLFHFGRPKVLTGFQESQLDKNIDKWDPVISPVFVTVMFLILYVSGTGLYVNKKRHRRKNDKYYISLLSLIVMSIMGLTYFYFN